LGHFLPLVIEKEKKNPEDIYVEMFMYDLIFYNYPIIL
jgi:hypothetical protein